MYAMFSEKNVRLFETHPFTNSRFDKYSIRKSMIPKFLSLSWVKKILNTGKSINFLRCVCDDSTSNITNREKGIKSINLYRKGYLSKRPLYKRSLPKKATSKKTIYPKGHFQKGDLQNRSFLKKRNFNKRCH